MAEFTSTMRRLLRRASTPLSAALIFCAVGLTCAVGVISINRLLSMRPPPTAAAQPSPSAAASPSASPSASAAPTPAAAACTTAPAPGGQLAGLVVAADATVLLATTDTTMVVVVPSGAQVSGHPGDVHAQLPAVAGPAQPVSGTVVRDATICATGSAGLTRINIGAGTSVSGSAVASAGGIEAANVRFSGGGGGGGGGDGGD